MAGKGASPTIMPELEIMSDAYETISRGAGPSGFINSLPARPTVLNLPVVAPRLLSPGQDFVKRSMDIGVSTLVILGTSPVWLPLLACVWADTKAAPIYTQERVGKDGRVFTLYKFRSMRADAEANGPQLTTKDDRRVTRLGRFLRKFRVDEFAQFVNVLKGDMSLVGPRPERPYFVQEITKRAPQYTHLHRIRPGLTSWGQVKFGYAENVDEMLERMHYDLLYLQKIGLKTDLKIIRATVRIVLSGCGQ